MPANPPGSISAARPVPTAAAQAGHGLHKNLSDALLWLDHFHHAGSLVVGVDAFRDYALDLQHRFDNVQANARLPSAPRRRAARDARRRPPPAVPSTQPPRAAVRVDAPRREGCDPRRSRRRRVVRWRAGAWPERGRRSARRLRVRPRLSGGVHAPLLLAHRLERRVHAARHRGAYRPPLPDHAPARERERVGLTAAAVSVRLPHHTARARAQAANVRRPRTLAAAAVAGGALRRARWPPRTSLPRTRRTLAARRAGSVRAVSVSPVDARRPRAQAATSTF